MHVDACEKEILKMSSIRSNKTPDSKLSPTQETTAVQVKALGLRRTALEMKALGYSAVQCRDAGLGVPELIQHCHCPWEKGDARGSWRGFEGRAIIAEGKFGHITAVRPEAAEDIKVEYADGSTNSVNTSGGFLATDWIERGMCRLLIWSDERPPTAGVQEGAAGTQRANAKDHDTLKAIVAKAVAGRIGWEDVTPEDVVLTDRSGYGGSSTFKCTRKSAGKTGPAVALHVTSESFSYSLQPEFVKRSRAASHALAAAGVAPQPIDEYEDQWFIDEWEGDTIDSAGVEQAVQLGCLLARIHAVPPLWYDSIRESYTSRFPVLSAVPASSSLWFCTARNCWMNENRPEWAVRLFAAEELVAHSLAGKRVCTVHADFHAGNIVHAADGSGLKVVDMEQSGVMSAAFDFAYGFSMGVCQGKNAKLALCAAYLEEAGMPHDAESVKALALDGERLRLTTPLHRYFEKCNLGDVEPGPPHAVDELLKFRIVKAVADAALGDPVIADDIISNGLWESYAVKVALGDRWLPCLINPYGVGVAVTAHTVQQGTVPSRNSFALNWDGTIRPLAAPAHFGRVLGAGPTGRVVLTSHSAENRLVVKIAPGFPISGYAAPVAGAVKLMLGGAHAGKALVWKSTFKYEGHVVGQIALGEAKDGFSVHFDPCGAIRLAQNPHMAFDIEQGRHVEGTSVNTFTFQDASCHRFSLNHDGTISVADAPQLILALNDQNKLALRGKDTASDEERLLFPCFQPRAGRQLGDVPPPRAVAAAQPLRLELTSHPGRAVALARFDKAAVGEHEMCQLAERRAVLPTHTLVVGDPSDAIEVMVDANTPIMTILTAEVEVADKCLALGAGFAEPARAHAEATGPVAVTDGSQLADGDEIVTCWFAADDWIDEVFYNNADMCDYTLTGVPFVTERPKGADALKTLRFKPVVGGVLAIAANDTQPGTSAAFVCRCTSTCPESRWNFELNAQTGGRMARVSGTGGRSANAADTDDENVGSMGGKGGRDEKWTVHPAWTTTEFDDSEWLAPNKASCDYWPRAHGMAGTWCHEHKYVFYRICPDRAE